MGEARVGAIARATRLCTIVVAFATLLRPGSAEPAHLDGAGDQDCSYYGSYRGIEKPPFVYTAAPGAAKDAEGLSPVCDAESGAYYYPDLQCEKGPCCSQTPVGNLRQNISKFIILGGSGLVLVFFFGCLTNFRCPCHKDLISDPTGIVLFGLGTMFQIAIGVVMPMLQQQALAVEDRNSMNAAGAFLTPIAEGFSFIEDSVTVQISQALGAGNTEFAQFVLVLGAGGGFVLGLLGAACMTVLACIPAVLQALVAPGHEALPGCRLTRSPAEVADLCKVFWLTCVWGWPISFANNAMSGYVLGLRQIGVLGVAMVLSGAANFFVWIVFQPKSAALAGWAGFASSVVFAAVTATSIGCQLQRSSFRFSKDALDKFKGSAGKEVLLDDLQAMVLDLSLQMCITIGIYVSGDLGSAIFYQVSALNSALPMYGTAQASLVNYVLKLAGGALVGAKKYEMFKMLVIACLMVAVSFGCLAFAAVVPFRYALAFSWGAPACQFASSTACLPIYTGVFGTQGGGNVPLQESFIVLAFAAGSSCIYSVAKAGLYCCSDYSFMAGSAILMLVCVFLPLILVAKYVIKEAAAVYFAMFFPQFFLGLLFCVRLARNIHKMLLGQKGPWIRASASPPTAAATGADAASAPGAETGLGERKSSKIHAGGETTAAGADDDDRTTDSEDAESSSLDATDEEPDLDLGSARRRRSSLARIGSRLGVSMPDIAVLTSSISSMKGLPTTGTFRHSLGMRM